MKSDVQGRHVIITLQDSWLIARLFALRPDSVPIVSHVPRYLGDTRRSFAHVQYVEPRLPDLDSAGYAKALHEQREYDARVLSLGRSLSGGNEGQPLWLMVGDSVQLGIEEWQCQTDLCGHYFGFLGAPQNWGRWSVDDPNVARVHRSIAKDVDFRFARHPELVRMIVALRPGKTRVRAVGVHTFADSVASLSPLDSILEREVLVTRPVSRVVITPRPTHMVAGDTLTFAVRVLDRVGRTISDAPVDLMWGVRRSHTGSQATKPVRVSFDTSGSYEIIAVLGRFADTVNVDVRTPERP